MERMNRLHQLFYMYMPRIRKIPTALDQVQRGG